MAFFLSAASVARANGAMGLAFERWEVGVWLAYVAVTVVFEAWFIGRRAEISIARAIWISVWANLLTGVFGVLLCSSIGAPALHGSLFGPPTDPNPFMTTVALLSISAVPTAILESAVWQKATKPVPQGLIGRVYLAHVLGIMIGLVVVLLPNNPHRVTVGQAVWARNNVVSQHLQSLESQIREKDRIPVLLNGLRPDVDLPKEFWKALSTPEYGRFAMRATREYPWVWNTALSGKSLTGGEDDWRWLARPIVPGPFRQIEVNTATGEVSWRWRE